MFGFNNMMIPCVYCLTTKQDEHVYTKILQHLLRIGQEKSVNLSPTRLTCDYELAAINTFKNIFLRYIFQAASFIIHSTVLMEKGSRIRSYSICQIFKFNQVQCN